MEKQLGNGGGESEMSEDFKRGEIVVFKSSYFAKPRNRNPMKVLKTSEEGVVTVKRKSVEGKGCYYAQYHKSHLEQGGGKK